MESRQSTAPAEVPFRKFSYTAAFVCVAILVFIGLLLRWPGARPIGRSMAAAVAPVSTPSQVLPPARPGLPAQNSPQVAEHFAKPLVEQIKKDPANFELLAKAGNTYLYSRDFSGAAEYYRRALAIHDDAKVRNDYANALYYSGDTVGSLAQYQTILKSDPKNENALFNRGIVLWRANHDAKGAVESWERLLQAMPDHPHRAQIKQLIAQASAAPAAN